MVKTDYILSIKFGWTGSYSIVRKSLTEVELNAYFAKVHKSGSKVIGVYPQDKC